LQAVNELTIKVIIRIMKTKFTSIFAKATIVLLVATIVNGGNTGVCAELVADIMCKNNPSDSGYATDWTPIGYDIKKG